jgi:arylsulfatase A-like enzyme
MRSYWQIFRLIFVIFSLYLVGDALYRWSGFRYYATLADFLPSVALITILWSIAAAFFGAITWIALSVIVWFSNRIGWKVRIDHGLFFILGSFVILGVAVWIVKRYLVGGTLMYSVGYAVGLSGVIFLSILIWVLRNKTEQLLCLIQEHISPLVWLFTIMVILSVPIVGYHAFWKTTDTLMPQKNPLPHNTENYMPNIILLTFDALTARNMSVYGYERPTTPYMEKWANEASVFTNLEAASNITTPATASLMTGKRLWTHQTYHLNGSPPNRVVTENLPLVLQNYGYHTMAFIVNNHASVKKLGLENNFDIAPLPTQFYGPVYLFGHFDKYLYQLFGDKIKLHDWIMQHDFIPYRLLLVPFGNHFVASCPPENALNKFLWAIDERPREPFFSWIHLYPPHDPYLPPKPFIGMFDPSLELRSYKSQSKVKEAALLYRDKFQDFPPEVQPVINTLRNRYDEYIRYSDKYFEDFIQQLQKRDKLKNTLIILSADHGESFEHGAIQHSGLHLYEQVTHIPLIIKEPHQSNGRIINAVVEQIDIPATILDLANIPVPIWMEGRSLAPLMRGEAVSVKPAFSMSFETNFSRGQKITKGTIAVREGDYKLIHYLNNNKSFLFNLDLDPQEIHDFMEKEPEKGQYLLNLIRENLVTANRKILEGNF